MNRLESLLKGKKHKNKKSESDDSGSVLSVSKTSKKGKHSKKKETSNESSIHSLTAENSSVTSPNSRMPPKKKPSLIGRLFDTAMRGICGSKRSKRDDSESEMVITNNGPSTSKKDKKKKNKKKKPKSLVSNLGEVNFPRVPSMDDHIYNEIESYKSTSSSNKAPLATLAEFDDIFDEDILIKRSLNDRHEAFEYTSTPKEGKLGDSNSEVNIFLDSPLLKEVKVINPDLATYSPPPDVSTIKKIIKHKKKLKSEERRKKSIGPQSNEIPNKACEIIEYSKFDDNYSKADQLFKSDLENEWKGRKFFNERERQSQERDKARISYENRNLSHSTNPDRKSTTNLSRKSSISEKNSTVSCLLCTKNIKIPVKLSCGHCVCALCLQKVWIHIGIWRLPQNCPVCNQNIQKLEVEENELLEDYLHPVFSYNTRLRYLSIPCFPELQGKFCTICENNLEISVLLNCGHQFCADCLYNHWKEYEDEDGYYVPCSCPICKTPVTKLISLLTNEECNEESEIVEAIEEYNENIEEFEKNLKIDYSELEKLINQI